MPTLYRAQAATPNEHAADSRRPPTNVPYVVDNLWEWARPEHLPSRRGAAYASPTAELAWKNAKADADTLVTLTLPPMAMVLQVPVPDARHHADCQPKSLRKVLFDLLNELHPDWANQPAITKQPAAVLFLPTASCEEMQAVLGTGGPLASIADRLRTAITLWNTAQVVDLKAHSLPFETGEIFFSRSEASSYEIIGHKAAS